MKKQTTKSTEAKTIAKSNYEKIIEFHEDFGGHQSNLLITRAGELFTATNDKVSGGFKDLNRVTPAEALKWFAALEKICTGFNGSISEVIEIHLKELSGGNTGLVDGPVKPVIRVMLSASQFGDVTRQAVERSCSAGEALKAFLETDSVADDLCDWASRSPDENWGDERWARIKEIASQTN